MTNAITRIISNFISPFCILHDFIFHFASRASLLSGGLFSFANDVDCFSIIIAHYLFQQWFCFQKLFFARLLRLFSRLPLSFFAAFFLLPNANSSLDSEAFACRQHPYLSWIISANLSKRSLFCIHSCLIPFSVVSPFRFLSRSLFFACLYFVFCASIASLFLRSLLSLANISFSLSSRSDSFRSRNKVTSLDALF